VVPVPFKRTPSDFTPNDFNGLRVNNGVVPGLTVGRELGPTALVRTLAAPVVSVTPTQALGAAVVVRALAGSAVRILLMLRVLGNVVVARVLETPVGRVRNPAVPGNAEDTAIPSPVLAVDAPTGRRTTFDVEVAFVVREATDAAVPGRETIPFIAFDGLDGPGARADGARRGTGAGLRCVVARGGGGSRYSISQLVSRSTFSSS
jgi:hypothetical protein